MSVRVIILRAPGTNCDEETAFAFEAAGAVADRIHVNRVLESPGLLDDYQILCLPGGFSYGDDVAAGRIFANQIRHHLSERIRAFRDDNKLILGICNGFQVLLKSGLLLDEAGDEASAPAQATLTWNDNGRFEDRWVHLQVDGNRSVFLKDIEQMYLPIAHAEGKFVTLGEEELASLKGSQQLALRYANASGSGNGAALDFPLNPNGSQENVAGVCDATGRVLGLMPHPERFIDPTQHPRWTRGEAGTVGEGLQIFQNAVGYFA